MANANTGINFAVYSARIDKYGDAVVRTPITLTTSNIEGDETTVAGTTGSLQVYIVRKARPWTFDKIGMVEGGDAMMLVKADNTINRHDLITWNDNTYRVQTVLNRDQIGGNIAYKACNLYLVEP